MKLFRINDLQSVNDFNFPTSVAIGNFDGVHLGHQKILQQLMHVASSTNTQPTVIFFEPLSHEFINKTVPRPRITGLREKLNLMRDHGIRIFICLKFNEKILNLNYEDFISLIKNKFNVLNIIVGEDFRFGCSKHGNIEILKQLSTKHCYNAFVVENLISNDQQKISSSLIRQLLCIGAVDLVQKYLGRHYSIHGRIVNGNGYGKKLLFIPTAGIKLKNPIHVACGVYAVYINGIENIQMHGVANIGYRPTLDGENLWLEVYILDYCNNIYGKKITIEFVKKIREEQKFSSIAKLRHAVTCDIYAARLIFTNITYAKAL